ncbi:MAG: tetratricopeptide repeat protein [bacterium]|nr:tetratricopeptide repeat protein [bacterium]
MTATRQQQVLEVLDATLASPPMERSEFLDQACGDDEELRREVESLLELEDDADEFLPRPAMASLTDTQPLEKGLRIGPYRVVELLGRGGMGAVYRATRQDDFEKDVAIKLVQRDLIKEAVVRRFLNERQILARLEHPSIAQLLDGGTTEDGRPYLVMEYVHGEPIDEYCDDHALSVRQRLKLFVKVCSPLAFAHRNLVVHRDLKPGNILITDEGEPKLLDFGIAKLLASEEAMLGDLTQGSEQPMTPRYASPEQVKRQPITTASDIHALGSLLYKLLTGRLPCELESCRFGEIPWRICEQEPTRPSVAVGREEKAKTTAGMRHWTPESVSRTREGDPKRLRRRLAGDVDAIVLKALRKEPHRRYGSVEQLAADIQRHLDGLPVEARRGTTLYRAGKLLRRYRWTVAAVLTVLLAAGVFLVRERQRIETERRSLQVLRGLVNTLDPDRRDDLTEALENARRELEVLDADPDLRSELAATLGRIYLKHGDTEQAHELWSESLEIWRQQRPNDLSGLAARINNVGVSYLHQGDYATAEKHLREALKLRDELGDESPDIVPNMNNLATTLLYRGAYTEAEELYRRGLNLRIRTLGREDPTVASSLRSLATVIFARGDPVAAEPLLREAFQIRVAAFGDRHSEVAAVLDLLGSVRFAQGDPLEAEDLYDEALRIRRKRLGDDSSAVAWTERNLGVLLLAEGDLASASVLLSRASSILLRTKPLTDWRNGAVTSDLGALYKAAGRFVEAEPCLLEGYLVLHDARGEQAIYTREARRRILELYEAWGRPEMAAPFRMLAQQKERAAPGSSP